MKELKVGDLVRVIDSRYAMLIEREEYVDCLDSSLFKDPSFEVIKILRDDIMGIYNICIRNIKTKTVYLSSKAFVELIKEDENKTYKQATLDKWLWFIFNPGRDYLDYQKAMNKPEEKKIVNYCWACELARISREIFFPDCTKCPIKAFRECSCRQESSLFNQWLKNKTAKTAQAVYNAILTTWED